MQTIFPGADKFFHRSSTIESLDPQNFGIIFEDLINLTEMALHLFIATTIRYYENTISSPSDKYTKKVKYIKKLLREKYTAPSLGTVLDLARNCYHFIDRNQPDLPLKLNHMCDCLSKSFKLEEIAYFYNDLENIVSYISSVESKTKTIYNPLNKQALLTSIIPKLVEYRNNFKHLRDIPLLIPDLKSDLMPHLENWKKALSILSEAMSPLISHTYVHKSIKEVYTSAEGYLEEGKRNLCLVMKVWKYRNGFVEASDEPITFEEYESTEEYQRNNLTYLIIENNQAEFKIDLFPFLLIDNAHLYYYKRTKHTGYEYFCVSNNRTIVQSTKRKFSHSLFGIGSSGDRQALFWTEVVPTTNPINHIKANIPTEGQNKFVGRTKQRAVVREEIIEIPNQNGIIYGPGGVGKTALMLRICNCSGGAS